MRTPDNTDVYEPTEGPTEAPAPTVADEQERDTPRVPVGVVQREWDQTLTRIRERCEVQDGTTRVSERQYAHLLINKTEGLDIEQVEAILFENLLFSPWARVEHARSYILSGEWLWKWRRKAPWKADPVGHMIRLAPDAPKRMWTYRFNVIDAWARARQRLLQRVGHLRCEQPAPVSKCRPLMWAFAERAARASQ